MKILSIMPCLSEIAKQASPLRWNYRQSHMNHHVPGIWWRVLQAGLLDLLLPPRCHICHTSLPPQSEARLCPHCLGQVRYLQSPLCVRCGQPFPPGSVVVDHYCGNCLRLEPPFDSARSLVYYQYPVSNLLQRLKFMGEASAARTLATLNRPLCPRVDLIVAVPLHPARLRARGGNQSLVLARRFFPAEHHKIVLDLLVRRKNTVPQTGLNGHQRRHNLQNAFAVDRPERLRNRSVLLVDDVFTTGTTLAECSRALKTAGAASVQAWTVARAEVAR